MLEKLKKNMNEWHYHSLAVTILAIITILKYEEVVLSIVLITISTVLNGIGALYNQNKKIINRNERIEKMTINLMFKDREEIIKQRMEDYKNGNFKILSQEELDQLLEEKETKCH